MPELRDDSDELSDDASLLNDEASLLNDELREDALLLSDELSEDALLLNDDRSLFRSLASLLMSFLVSLEHATGARNVIAAAPTARS